MTGLQILAIFAGVIVTTAGTVFAARYASRSSVKAKEIDVKATAYTDAQAISKESIQWLRDQVTDIKNAHKELRSEHDELKARHETQGSDLENVKQFAQEMAHDLKVAVNWMEQFLIWEQDGSRPPRPHIPAGLRKHINQALLTEQRKEQLEHNREDG